MDTPTGTAGTGHDTNTVTWPVWLAMPLVFAVFVAGAVWSFREQTALAANSAFHIPELLPLSIDGFAVSMAAVAWAASLDGRAAVFARLGVATGIAASAATNAAWAWQRSNGHLLTVIVAAAVPVLAMVAFEVLLAEVRRQVQRRRGLPRPVPVPWPQLIRLALAPISTITVWRSLVLDRTDPNHQFAIAEGHIAWKPPHETESTGTGSGSSHASSSDIAEPDSTRRASGAGATPRPKRTQRMTSSRKTGSGSSKPTDTELVSEIITNGWAWESQNFLASKLKVGKPRAAALQRRAQQQLEQNLNQPLAPDLAPAPVPAPTPAPAPTPPADSTEVPAPETTTA